MIHRDICNYAFHKKYELSNDFYGVSKNVEREKKIENFEVTDFQIMFCRFAEFASGVLSEQVEPLIRKVLKTSHIPNVNFRY